MKFFLLFLMLVALTGCGHKKVVAKNCDQAANSGVYICDPL